MPACKCRYCQASLRVKNAYKSIIKNKSAYFCNQEHYSLYMENLEEAQKQIKYNKQMKDKVYYLVCEILGRKAIGNTALWKEKELWNRVCTDEVIAQYLEENKDYLISIVSRLDNVEYNRIRYLSAVLKNTLGDYKSKVKEETKIVQVDETLYDNIQTRQNKRRSLADLEDEY